MVTITTTKVKLLEPSNKNSYYKFLIYTLYVLFFVVIYKIKNYTVQQYFLLPEDKQVLSYKDFELEDAKLYNYTLPQLTNTKNNILTYWEDGNSYYEGLKLLFLIPATIHLIYLLFNYWSASFKAHTSYRETKNPKNAHYVLLNVTHKTGMVHQIHKIYMQKIYHYYYNQQYYQQVEFENEKFNIVQENDNFVLQKYYQGEMEKIPQVYNVENGLTTKQHYALKQNYGENRIILRFPNYAKILGDEILTPYFAFQVFTSILYSMDSFALFSLLSLSMLFFSQGANVFAKYNTLKQTCKLAPKPVMITVIRGGKKQDVSSATLVPGDLVVYDKNQYNNITDENDETVKEQQQFVPASLILKNPMFKLIFRFQELLFGKYYDEKIYKNLNRIKRTLIFPADMLLIKGQLISDESILTGEQASQIKEKIDQMVPDEIQHFNQIFSGTKLIQIQSDESHLLVVKTAQQTEQGKLIKTIAFNEDRMNITTKDSIQFLLLMFVAAIISSLYAFTRGYSNNVTRLSNLILQSLIIFVQVIPPDLPTELSMCISSSIREMRLRKVFSSEPYRILNAGRVQYICFDKSGTLTQTNIKIIGVDDQLTVQSCTDIKQKAEKTTKPNIQSNDFSKMVIAGCQSLTRVGDKTIGDILEINAFEAINGVFDGEKLKYGLDTKQNELQIIKRFYFNSLIKKMSVIIKQNNKYYLVMKGSPESMQTLYTKQPQNYEKIVNEYTKKGLRILSLGYRELQVEQLELQRGELEQNIQFCGLLICETPLKKDTAESIEILKKAKMQMRVISGDHVLNVAVSAQKCSIIGSNEKILIVDEITKDIIKFHYMDNEENIEQCKLQEIKNLKGAICFTNSNNALQILLDEKDDIYKQLIQQTVVFARTTPAQKAVIVQKYQQLNAESRTMFVGDGVNDINALQSADVGIALLEEEAEKVIQKQKQIQQKQIPYPSFMIQPGNKPAGIMQIATEAQRRAIEKNTNQQVEMQILMRETGIYKQYLSLHKLNKFGQKNDMLAMWSEALDAEEEQQDIKMGDATIAAQFTVKSGSLEGVLDVIRQGRCALATVQMNFKTNALRCLIGAYSWTTLSLNGVRSSDYQMVASSLLQMMIVMNISKTKQQKQISEQKPPRTIVGVYLLLSVVLQTIIHMVALYMTQLFAGSSMMTMTLKTKFQPSQVNTCVFFVQMFLDVCVILVNFPGKPHMESLREFKVLKMSVYGFLAGIAVLIFDVAPEINQMLGLTELSNQLKAIIITIGAGDILLCFAAEKFAIQFFS